MMTCLPDPAHYTHRVPAFLAVVLLLACLAPATPGAEEEFVGPFASWLDVRRDFGAAGDGKTDDTPALQRALDEIREHKRASVLYLPAGTYRITQTLTTAARPTRTTWSRWSAKIRPASCSAGTARKVGRCSSGMPGTPSFRV